MVIWGNESLKITGALIVAKFLSRSYSQVVVLKVRRSNLSGSVLVYKPHR